MPPLKMDILIESNPLKSRILAQRLAAAEKPAAQDSVRAIVHENWNDTEKVSMARAQG